MLDLSFLEISCLLLVFGLSLNYMLSRPAFQPLETKQAAKYKCIITGKVLEVVGVQGEFIVCYYMGERKLVHSKFFDQHYEPVQASRE